MKVTRQQEYIYIGMERYQVLLLTHEPGKRPSIAFPQRFMAICSGSEKERKYIINYKAIVHRLFFCIPIRRSSTRTLGTRRGWTWVPQCFMAICSGEKKKEKVA